MAQQTLEQTIGTDRDYQLNLLTEDGEPATGFVSADSITAEIWGGGDTAAVAEPTATWIDAAAGTLKLTIAAADLSGLDAQPYPIRVTIDHGGRSILAWQGWLLLRAAPGAGTPVPVYCSYRDMLDLSGEWLNRLAMESTYSGFRRERGRARETLDDWILARWRPTMIGAYDRTVYGDWSTVEGPDPYLRSLLDADALMVRPAVVRVAAHLALHYVCAGQHEDDYQAKATYFGRKALALAKGLTAEIDADGDGTAELTVPLGTINIRIN